MQSNLQDELRDLHFRLNAAREAHRRALGRGLLKEASETLETVHALSDAILWARWDRI